MVAKDSKKGHNTLLCTVGAFVTSQLQLLTPIPGVLLNIGQYLLNYFAILFWGGNMSSWGGNIPWSPPPPPQIKPCIHTHRSLRDELHRYMLISQVQ